MVDDDAGGDHRDLARFLDRAPGSQGGSYVGGHRIAGPDYVDFASDGPRWKVSRFSVRRSADDTAFRKGNEDASPMLLGKDGGGTLDLFQIGIAFGPHQRR